MPDMKYVYIASGFVLLAVILRLITRFDAQAWATKGLRRGDLYCLVDVVSGLRPDGLTRDQATRLQARGMARPYGNGNFRATIKGRLALYIRRVARERSGKIA